MTSWQICIIGFLYYCFILLISKISSRNSKESEYIKTTAPAWLVTLGIVGDSISGVTYLSVPGTVGVKSFSYLAICFGNFVGYGIIAFVFLPLYHRKNFVSVYEWIGSRLGGEAQRISSFLFVLSRIFGSSARLCLTAGTLHLFVFREFNLGSEFSILAVTLGISLYTLKSGIKSLIVTDLVQSAFLVVGVLATTVFLFQFVESQGLPTQFFRPILMGEGMGAWAGFWKSFFSGILITLSMTGLDQNIMQKTFSVTDLRPLQQSFLKLAVVVLVVNAVVLVQGSLLAQSLIAFPEIQSSPSDQHLIRFVLANQNLFFQVLFVLGLSAATLNSADSVITTVTSSIKVDLLGRAGWSLLKIHGLVTVLLGFTTLAIYRFSSGSAIDLVLKSAGWTYGPLLGFFAIAAFGWKSTKVSLRLALLFSFASAFLMHLYFPLGVEVILVISLLLLAFNRFFVKATAKV